jgi:hypothetical protein
MAGYLIQENQKKKKLQDETKQSRKGSRFERFLVAITFIVCSNEITTCLSMRIISCYPKSNGKFKKNTILI